MAHLTVGSRTSDVPGMPDRQLAGTAAHDLHALRDEAVDHLYGDELVALGEEAVHLACSRAEPEGGHVQGEVRAQGALAWRLLRSGATVDVCGSLDVRDRVRDACSTVQQRHGRTGARGARTRLAASGRDGTEVRG